MSKKLKHTLQEENRAFNDEWELQYFVVSVNDKKQCLLCDVVISTLKKYNAHQHYRSHQGKVAIEASYKVAYLLGKRGKPFSNAELVKDCVIEVVRCLDPEKVIKGKEVPLSRRTKTDQYKILQTS